MNPLIETEPLSKSFGKMRAVQDVSFSVPAGTITAFLGSNGAGKTTTIQMLLNLIRPTSGTATVLGCDSRKIGPKQLREIGYVSENMELPLSMTVQQYMKYCRPFYPTWDPAMEEQLLEEFQLPRDRKLRQLSRGMRMKAALIGGIAYRPHLVILDEPFSGLDPLVRDEFIRGLLRLADEVEWTVFLSSHDMDEVERLADRLLWIDSGKIRIDESTEHLLNQCRRIDVVCKRDIPEEFQVPQPWKGFRKVGRSATFVLSDFQPNDDWEKLIRNALPETERISSNVMSLREVFVMLAEQYRKESR